MSIETNFQKFDQKISIHQQQAAAIAYLGQLALSNPGLDDLFADTATLMTHLLPADVVLISELDGEKNFSIKATAGWKEGTTLQKQLPVVSESLEAIVLRSPYPILVDNLALETRFQPSSLLLEDGVIGGIAVLLGTVNKPYGIMESFTRKRQTFSQNDIHFFHSIANILASALHSKRSEAEWAAREQELKMQLIKAQSILQSGHVERDRYEIKNRLVESRERERLHLAQELHDMPIQDLYGLMYQMDDLKEMIKDTHGMEILEDFNNTLHRVVNNLRAVCGELRPPSLSPFGLEVAIRDHVEKLRPANPDLRIHLDLMRDQQNLSDGIRLCLFRVYQQAINNVIRHAQATDVHIRFRWDDLVVVLEIEDNGKGFEMPDHWVDLVRQEHFGLVGIAERVESLHGELKIESIPGNGTLIQVSVPRR